MPTMSSSKLLRTGMAVLAMCAATVAVAQVTSRDLGGSYGTHGGGQGVPVPVPVPVPDIYNRNGSGAGHLDKPMTTSGNTCACQVADTNGSACMIFLRTNAADWIAKNSPQTALRSSASGRYYDAPFTLTASACAGRKVAPGGVKVHWLDRRNAVIEWK